MENNDRPPYRIIVVERDGQWIASAEQDGSGKPFGIECVGASKDGVTARPTRWLDWQREHATALEALQEAERAYHRTIAGSAFASPIEGPSPLEMQKDALRLVEAARVRLDDIRDRRPE